MTAPEFDPALVEQAAEAGCRAAHSTRWEYRATSHVCDDCARITLAVLTAVAPTLRADGARQVLAAVEAMVAEWGQVVPPLDPPRAAVSVLAAAREAVTRIADGDPS